MARQSDRNDERDDENISAKGGEKSSEKWSKSNGESGRRKADAIEMLKEDHRRVEALFDKYEQAKRRAEKSKLAQQICLELTIHTALEEEIFYPACREHVDDPLLDEAQVEHDTAKILVAEIAMAAPQSDPFFDAKVKVLGEYVRHHIQEEEKSPESIFAKAVEDGVDTAKLGERMMRRREALMEEYDEELLLPQPKTLHLQLEQEEEVWAEPPGGGTRGGESQRGREGGGWGREFGGRERWEGRGWEQESGGGFYDERRGGGREEEGRGWGGREGGESRGARGRGGEAGRMSGQERSGQERSGRETRGWHGDPKRHSEASRKGWEHRR